MMAPMELVAEWERELDKHAQYLPRDLVNETIATLREYVLDEPKCRDCGASLSCHRCQDERD